MLEWMEKYREVPREQTALTIDRPMLIFLGLTLTDFVAGVVVVLAVMMLWDSSAAILVGLAGGGAASWVAREYRQRCPPRFLQHWSWAMGLQSIRGVPRLFRKRRYVVFGP